MSNHFIAINRGTDGFRVNDFTTGTTSSASSDFELRIADADGQGNVVKRKDVVIALQAFIMAMESGQTITNSPPI